MLYKRSSQLFAEAEKVIPGGVNSPVRAFKAVGGTPIFVKSAKGAYMYDEDGNPIESAPRAKQIVKLKLDKKLDKDYMLRKPIVTMNLL